MPRKLIVEADGGSRGNPGPAAYGAVIRDAVTGAALRETAEYLGTATNNVAEYRGLLAGLRAARELDPHAVVEARLDSKLVVEQMSGRWKIKNSDLRTLASQIARVYPQGAQVTYVWVPRARNTEADRLANEALDAAAAGRVWAPREAVAEAEVGRPELPEPTGERAQPGWGAPSGTHTSFVLVRHGETALTAEKRFSGTGSGDPELVERGRWQAERIAALLAGRGGADALLCSPTRRTRQTAEILASRLGLEVRVEEDLREVTFGEWEGHTFAEVQRCWPAELDAWLSATSVAPPGGESFDALAERVSLLRDKTIARYSGRTVLLVSHVSPIKTLVRMALEAPAGALFRMELHAGSVSAIHWYEDGNASLRLFNETSHLR